MTRYHGTDALADEAVPYNIEGLRVRRLSNCSGRKVGLALCGSFREGAVKPLGNRGAMAVWSGVLTESELRNMRAHFMMSRDDNSSSGRDLHVAKETCGRCVLLHA
jgi:hypothetical protein